MARASPARGGWTPSPPTCASAPPLTRASPARGCGNELKELGYTGGYTAVTDYLREVRPREPAPFELRFETPAGH